MQDDDGQTRLSLDDITVKLGVFVCVRWCVYVSMPVCMQDEDGQTRLSLDDIAEKLGVFVCVFVCVRIHVCMYVTCMYVCT